MILRILTKPPVLLFIAFILAVSAAFFWYRSENIGASIGSGAGKMTGLAVGSYRGVTDKIESVDSKRKFVTLKDEDDVGNYMDSAMDSFLSGEISGKKIETYSAVKDLKIATYDQVVKDVLKKYGNDKISDHWDSGRGFGEVTDGILKDMGNIKVNDLFKEASDFRDIYRARPDSISDYKDSGDMYLTKRAEIGRAYLMSFFDKRFDTDTTIRDKYKQKGYDAVVDVLDVTSGWGKQPMILLDPQNSVKKIDSKDIPDYDPELDPKGNLKKHW